MEHMLQVHVKPKVRGNIRLKVDFDAATRAGLADECEHPRRDGGPLDSKRCNQQVEGDTAVAIATKECHQEPETNEYHDMDILENCA